MEKIAEQYASRKPPSKNEFSVLLKIAEAPEELSAYSLHRRNGFCLGSVQNSLHQLEQDGLIRKGAVVKGSGKRQKILWRCSQVGLGFVLNEYFERSGHVSGIAPKALSTPWPPEDLKACRTTALRLLTAHAEEYPALAELGGLLATDRPPQDGIELIWGGLEEASRKAAARSGQKYPLGEPSLEEDFFRFLSSLWQAGGEQILELLNLFSDSPALRAGLLARLKTDYRLMKAGATTLEAVLRAAKK